MTIGSSLNLISLNAWPETVQSWQNEKKKINSEHKIYDPQLKKL